MSNVQIQKIVSKFPLGQVVSTPGAMEVFAEAGKNPYEYVMKHQAGDWGIVGEADAKENEFSLEHGYRILSAYTVGTETVWIITEADRSATTILLPSEY